MRVEDEPVPGAAVRLELFSPDRLQVGERLAALEVDRAGALLEDLVDRYPDAADARHGLAVALRWRKALEEASSLEPAAAATLLWRELHVEGEPMTEGCRRAVFEKLLAKEDRGELLRPLRGLAMTSACGRFIAARAPEPTAVGCSGLRVAGALSFAPQRVAPQAPFATDGVTSVWEKSSPLYRRGSPSTIASA